MDNSNQTQNQIPNVPQQPSFSQQPTNNKNMKPCKSCGTLIAKKAKVCPNCGAKNKSHKALIIILIALGVIILVAALGSGGDSSDSDTTTKNNAGKNAAVETENVNDNTLGQYSVEIKKVRLTSTYDGKPAVVVTYQFTNNSNDNPTAFYVAFEDQVYQNGVGLNKAYLLKDGDPYNPENDTKEIKKGASIEVEQAYELNDSSTPIDIEVKELFSFSDKIISKTYNLK